MPVDRTWSRTLGACLVMAGLLATPALAEIKIHGLEIVPWSKKLEEDRYQSSRDYERTKKFYRDMFRGWRYIKWQREVNLPSVKYVHIKNTFPKRKWDGINIYELPGGIVKIYVLKHTDEAAAEDDADVDEKAGGKKSEGAPAADAAAESVPG